MRVVRLFLFMAFAFGASCLSVLPASAEFFIDGYAGIALTNDADSNLTGTSVFGPSYHVSGTTKWKDSFVFGGRMGYWFDTVPFLGLALDVSWFQPEEDVSIGPAKIDVMPISVLLMYRVPLGTSPDFPQGRFQPYLGVGPGAFYTKFKLDYTSPGMSIHISDTSWDIGLDVRGGLTFLFTRNIGIFAEYRFTYVDPQWEVDLLSGGRPIGTLTGDIELATHHIMGGLTLRF